MSGRLLLPGAVRWPVGPATRVAALLSFLALPSLAAPVPPSRPERAIRVTVEDPCPALAARGKGKSVRIGGVALDLEGLYFASCDYLKGQIVESVEGSVEEIKGKYTDEAWGAADGIYKEFLAWLRPVAARELGIDPASPGFDVALRAWVTDPDTAVAPLVDAFLAERAPRVAALLERLQNDTSREIAEGLGTLWEDAKDRFERFNRAYAEIERDPKTPYADILVTWGLSGPWLEKFQSYEHRFNVFDDRTRLLDASRTLYEALSADRHRDRIAGLFSLLETVGEAAERSDVPGVSFFGQVVGLYGQIANELLQKVNALEDMLRRREGYCIGLATHTLEETRSVAFRRQFGDGIQACPVDPKRPLESAVYQQTEPADADQLYFWLDEEGRFVKGQERGGGMSAVLIARRLIGNGAEIGFTELSGREDDLATVSAFYNTPYRSAEYGDGLPGVRSEAVATIEGIARRLDELERAVPKEGEGCDRGKLRDYLRESCGIDAERFPRDDVEVDLIRLSDSFALGVVAAANPKALASQRSVPVAERYRRAWVCLRPLSLLRIDGAVRRKGALGVACIGCREAELTVRIRNGAEIPGCGTREAGELGQFELWIAARSPGLAVTLSAEVDGRRSDTVVVDARSAPLEPFPFGAREERVVVPVDLGEVVEEDEEEEREEPPARAESLVPDLSGMNVEQARDALRARGLVLAVGKETIAAPTPHLASRVGRQSPPAGTAVPRGDRVEVSLYATTTAWEYEVPSLVGLTEAEALARLEEARLTATIERSATATSPGQAGRVFAQLPMAGTRVGYGTKVRLQVYVDARLAPPTPTPIPWRPPPPPPSPTPTQPPAPPPDGGESTELAGVWDTGRGMVVRIRPVSEGQYAGTLVRVTKPLRAFFWQPGETLLHANRTGPGTYLVAILVRLGNGRVIGGPEAAVVVHGSTAQAANATWTRVGPP